MSRSKDKRIFSADRCEFVDIEETPVIDFFCRDSPVRESIGLIRQQGVKRIEAAGLTFDTVKKTDVVFDKGMDGRILARQGCKPLLNDFLLSITLDHFVTVSFCP